MKMPVQGVDIERLKFPMVCPHTVLMSTYTDVQPQFLSISVRAQFGTNHIVKNMVILMVVAKFLSLFLMIYQYREWNMICEYGKTHFWRDASDSMLILFILHCAAAALFPAVFPLYNWDQEAVFILLSRFFTDPQRPCYW